MVLLICAAVVTGCGAKAEDGPVDPSAAVVPALVGAQARPAAPPASNALTQVPDGRAAQTRLGYVNLQRLSGVSSALAPERVQRAVLGTGAARLQQLPAGAVQTAIQVQDATVLRGPGLTQQQLDGARPSGTDGLVVGPGAAALTDTGAQVNAIQGNAVSAVQSCIGDPVAQTVLGPATLGRDRAIGVGLQDAGGTPTVALCFAPRLVRHIHEAQTLVARRFPGATVREEEIGERDMLLAELPLQRLGARELAALLRGGPALQRLAVDD